MTPRRLVKIRSKKRKRAALKAAKLWCKPLRGDSNPLGTDGFEFVEYAAPVVSVRSKHLGLRGAAVIGVPDPVSGEAVRGLCGFGEKARNCH